MTISVGLRTLYLVNPYGHGMGTEGATCTEVEAGAAADISGKNWSVAATQGPK